MPLLPLAHHTPTLSSMQTVLRCCGCRSVTSAGKSVGTRVGASGLLTMAAAEVLRPPPAYEASKHEFAVSREESVRGQQHEEDGSGTLGHPAAQRRRSCCLRGSTLLASGMPASHTQARIVRQGCTTVQLVQPAVQLMCHKQTAHACRCPPIETQVRHVAAVHGTLPAGAGPVPAVAMESKVPRHQVPTPERGRCSTCLQRYRRSRRGRLGTELVCTE